MSFKIVSTKEKHGVYFCVVPYQWEINGTLFWPEHLTSSKREQLRCDSTSVPEEHWTSYPCILKITGLENFREALKIETQLTQCSDTDAEEALFMKTKNKKRTTKEQSDGLSDRNHLFDEFHSNYRTTDKNVNIISDQLLKSSSTSQYNTILLQDNSFSNDIPAINYTLQECAPSQDIQLKLLNADIQQLKTEMINMRHEIFTIKEDLKIDYHKININLDKIYKILSEKQIEYTEKKVEQQKDLLTAFSFPIKSCEEIEAVDHAIRNDGEFKRQLIIFLSKIGGTNGKEDGGKVAYKVIDQMIYPTLLIKYSWTGISREKNQAKKKTFQILEGILDVFFEVILLADSRHTREKNCNFFKGGILKYATKRSLRKHTQSGQKERPTTPNEESDSRINENCQVIDNDKHSDADADAEVSE